MSKETVDAILSELFENNFDCYADSPDVVMAITKEKFIELVKQFQQLPSPSLPVKSAEEILKCHIDNYNKGVTDFFKFTLRENEVKVFVKAMDEYAKQYIPVSEEEYCNCHFVMIMRDELDYPRCSECKKLVKEEMPYKEQGLQLEAERLYPFTDVLAMEDYEDVNDYNNEQRICRQVHIAARKMNKSVSEEEKNVYRSEGWDACKEKLEEPGFVTYKSSDVDKEQFLSSFLPKKP